MTTQKISWLDAKAAGLNRYFTGRPCPRGHIAERRVASRDCIKCFRLRQHKRRRVLCETNEEFRSQKASYDREWYQKNKDRVKAARIAYYEANREKILTNMKPYVAANKEMYRAIKRNCEARRKLAPGKHTKADVADIRKMQKGRCAYCRLRLGEKYHVDHIQALARGGNNNRQNLQLLCPTCNCSKNAKDPIVFAQSRGMLL